MNVTRTRSPCCTVSSGPGTVPPNVHASTPPIETFRASRVKLRTGWPATVATRLSTDTDGWPGTALLMLTMPGGVAADRGHPVHRQHAGEQDGQARAPQPAPAAARPPATGRNHTAMASSRAATACSATQKMPASPGARVDGRRPRHLGRPARPDQDEVEAGARERRGRAGGSARATASASSGWPPR